MFVSNLLLLWKLRNFYFFPRVQKFHQNFFFKSATSTLFFFFFFLTRFPPLIVCFWSFSLDFLNLSSVSLHCSLLFPILVFWFCRGQLPLKSSPAWTLALFFSIFSPTFKFCQLYISFPGILSHYPVHLSS